MAKLRKYLSAAGLLSIVRKSFSRIPDKINGNRRNRKAPISLHDCLMSGLAVFNLKCASLLQFDKRKGLATVKKNLHNLYGIKTVPCDTQMRERLDSHEPEKLRPAFKQIFAVAQRGKAIEEFVYYQGHYLLSLDGAGQYQSKEVHCENCCEKQHKNGTISYYHQMLGAVIVHPKKKIVIPFAPEPITKQDGANKNDCERNAAKRLISHIRREHPHLKLMVIEDALSSNAPHIRMLQEHNMRFILGVKPDDHKYLFDWVLHSKCEEHTEVDIDGTTHHYRFINQVPLNDANHELHVNFLEYWEVKKEGKKQHFSWVTDFWLSKDNVKLIMRGGRARWKIENETFNTLKNQGYNFEHNYGHGNKNLCSIFTMLMMLSFLIDQVQELCCSQFQAARRSSWTKYNLWEEMRSYFRIIEFSSWELFLATLINAGTVPHSDLPCFNTS
jgi:hypothetical protein